MSRRGLSRRGAMPALAFGVTPAQLVEDPALVVQTRRGSGQDVRAE